MSLTYGIRQVRQRTKAFASRRCRQYRRRRPGFRLKRYRHKSVCYADRAMSINYFASWPGHTTADTLFDTATRRAFWARSALVTRPPSPSPATGTRSQPQASAGVLALDRGYVNFRRTVMNRDDFAEMSNGAIVTSGLPTLRQWQAELRVIGPTYGADASLEQHLRDWWPYSRRGITYFPQWFDMDYANGAIDPRINYRRRDHYITTGNQGNTGGGYTSHYTIEGEDDYTVYSKRKGGICICETSDRSVSEPRNTEKIWTATRIFR